jgi:hypothetical protein
LNESYLTRRGTLYEIDDEQQYVQTIYKDGANTGVPTFDDASEALARRLGYEGERDEVIWAMNRDHDLLHTLVSECAFGYEADSPALRYYIDGPPPKGVVPMEERVVFQVQRLVVALRKRGMPDAEIMRLLGARCISST